ncbi:MULTISPECIES: hypothetical protein [unclassified Sphingomonas]|uniref:hypothetical protein n=1 Tax=unclassified Sphingomonas TaxID=196159 RepID=UPI002151A5A0|nr:MULTISPECIES: hypothetical protein [unclassified Sphingomonas]MCR5872250.1 hypothetical protein [Sphingomonas sp. J344]UUX99443.1 hypothetical protein LRS08_18710 [Sphingomonas sp. J315]
MSMIQATYPDRPGHRGIDTSVFAAEAIAPDLGRLQRTVLHAVRAAGRSGATTEELAAILDIDRGSVQPRTSELRSKRLIADSGLRRRNSNGKRAIVWTLPEHALPAAQGDAR